jgi:acetyltransferase-like isoleucine patch superfamily enzyme
MKQLLASIIRRRNPAFRFDPALDRRMLLQFAFEQAWQLLRGCRLLLSLRAPRGAMLGPGVTFFAIHNIRWGRFLRLGAHVRLSALGREGITLGRHVGIGPYSRLIVATSLNDLGAHIRIGDHVGIGEYAYLGGAGGLEIGSDCIIGQYFSCHPENHAYHDLARPIRLQGVQRLGIRIGRDCWIGSKVTVLDGVDIGDGCVVAAGAVVTRSFPPHSVIGGVPARLLKTRTAKPQ